MAKLYLLEAVDAWFGEPKQLEVVLRDYRALGTPD